METAINEMGTRIKRLREERNYSQSYLAQKLGITQKAYSKIETNQTRLSVDDLLKIADILETSIDKLMGIETGNTYNNYNTHNGDGIVINRAISDKIIELYDKLLAAKDEEIVRLKGLVGSR